MPKNNHYKAIRCIEKRIQELNKEIELSEKILEEPEMLSDYHFASNDIANFTRELQELQYTITELIN